jgi:hypothetical protein
VGLAVAATALSRPGAAVRRVTIAGGVLLAALTALSLAAASQAFQADASLPTAWLQRPDRQAIQGHALTLVRDFPFSGIGSGDVFPLALSRHALLIDVPFLTYAHHLWLDVWLETGLVGLLAAAALATAIVTSASAGEAATLGPAFRGAYLGVFALLFHGLSDWRPAVDGWTWLPLFALLGLMAARLGSRRASAAAARTMAAVPAVVAAGVAIWIWPLGAAWDVQAGGLAELAARANHDSTAGALAAGAPAYDAALAIDPGQATAHRRLGMLAAALDDNTRAVAHLEAALQSAPDSWPTRKALGLAYVWVGRLPDAERLLRSLGDDDATARELDTWSWWQEQRGRTGEALNAAEVRHRLRPDAQSAARVALLSRGAGEAPDADKSQP